MVVNRSLGEDGSSMTASKPGALPELKEEDLEEKFVKGSGAGGQKVNKTSNRVILCHLPTQVKKLECNHCVFGSIFICRMFSLLLFF